MNGVKATTYAFLLLLICGHLNLGAQDLHFSQFSTTPSYLNPALTGQFNGDGRLTLNHRSQWKSVTVPYQSFGATADFSHVKLADALGAGLSVYNDRAGDSKFTTLKIDAAFSYKLPLSYDNQHTLRFGLQGGFRQLSIDYSELRFDRQYSLGTGYNPNAANGETFTVNQLISPTASAGLAYVYSGYSKTILLGIGAYNLLPTPTSFFVLNSIYNKKRYTFLANLEVEFSENILLTPSCFVSLQDQQYEALAGLQLKQIVLDNYGQYQALSVGTYSRFKDAFILTGNYEINDFNFGLSYDFNLSSLRKSSNQRGAYEVSLIYVYRTNNSTSRRFKTCPVFI